MPRRKPQPELSEIDNQPELPRGDEPKAKKARVIIPLTDSGELDMSRVKDPETLNRARVALGSDPVFAEVTEKPEVPKELIPVLYDGLAMAIGFAVKLAKWPKAFTDEQREQFAANLQYSPEFKEQAAEPTANLLSKALGTSRVALWLMENKDAALLIPLFANATYQMFLNAAVAFQMQEQAKANKANQRDERFTTSENRPTTYETAQPVPPPGVIATGAVQASM